MIIPRKPILAGLSYMLLLQIVQAQTPCANINPTFCRDGKLRQVCLADDTLIWMDDLIPILKLTDRRQPNRGVRWT